MRASLAGRLLGWIMLARCMPSTSPQSQAPLLQSDGGFNEPGGCLHEDSQQLSRHSQHYYGHALQAVSDMQSDYFQLWVGAWPTTIDWTAAVINTHLASILLTIGQVRRDSIDCIKQDEINHWHLSTFTTGSDSLINRYFMHSAAFYHGENAFLLRNEAFDDMLWVVLGWLEHVRLIDEQEEYHSARKSNATQWHGSEYSTVFAHRSRVFYELASKGWDETLCGGGMVWNQRLSPYKNAITNQLFISASIGMYLHFPGDSNRSPYSHPDSMAGEITSQGHAPGRPAIPADKTHLHNAIRAYGWLRNSGMLNHDGLYTDGFHITGWRRHASNGTRMCDDRNEMTYTYNQGVVLSGLRGLYEATLNATYLADGYELLRSVRAATGWSGSGGGHNYLWSGMGRGGVMEDYCDHTGHCNQDAQSFKGVFFLHLAAFCSPLRSTSHRVDPPGTIPSSHRDEHDRVCGGDVAEWVRWNADAALRSRGPDGGFGGWWNAHLVAEGAISFDDGPEMPIGSVDYKSGPSMGGEWRHHEIVVAGAELEKAHWKRPGGRKRTRGPSPGRARDLNDRGRGRTVETQGAGLAVVRAAYELSRNRTQ